MKKTLTTVTLMTVFAASTGFATHTVNHTVNKVINCPAKVTCTGQSYETCSIISTTSTTDNKWVLVPQSAKMCTGNNFQGDYVFTRALGGGYLSDVQGICSYKPVLGGGKVVSFYYNFNHRTISPLGSNWKPYLDTYVCTDGVTQCQFQTAYK